MFGFVRGLVSRRRGGFPVRLRVPGSKRQRLVIAVICGALFAATGVSTSFAATADTSREAAIRELLASSVSVDWEPRDMILAAPGRVIAATMTETPNPVAPESPTRYVEDVNRWRPNTDAWRDAKERLAKTTGLTSEDIQNTGRWNPKLLKAVKLGGGVASVLSGDTLVTWAIRDGVIYPSIESYTGISHEQAQDSVNSAYCRRNGNVVTDWFTGWVGANCADWRLDREYEEQGAVDPESMKGKMLCVENTCFTVVKAAPGSATTPNPPRDITGTDRKQYVVCGVWTNYNRDFGLQALMSHDSGEARWTSNKIGGWTFCSEPGQRNGFSPGDATGQTQVQLKSLRLVDSAGKQLNRVDFAVTPADLEWLTRVRCLDGSTRSSVSAPFPSKAGGAVAPPGAVNIANCIPTGVSIGQQPKGTGESGDWTTPGRERFATSDTDQVVQDWLKDTPQCWDGSCRLLLKKVLNDRELDCFDAPDECIEWFEQHKKDPTKYKCYYAGRPAPMEDCLVYKRVFDRQKVQDDVGFSDPKDGTDPKRDTKTNVGASGSAMNRAVQDPSKPRQCWPSGWAAFNPFEWVLRPVQCALEWAFVPRPTKVQTVQIGIRKAAEDSKFGEITRAMKQWGSFMPTSAACQGPHVALNLPFGAQYSGYPASACQEPMSIAATISHGFLLFVFGAAGFFALTRYAGRIFGYEGFGSLQQIAGRARDS